MIKPCQTALDFSCVEMVPNPAQDHLRLWVESPDEAEGRFELRDLSGRLWKTLAIDAGEQTATVDVSAFPTGFYLYVFRQKGKMPKVGKISIIH